MKCHGTKGEPGESFRKTEGDTNIDEMTKKNFADQQQCGKAT